MTDYGFADQEKTKRYTVDGGAWVELRIAFSKADDAIITDNSGVVRVLTDDGIALRSQAAAGDRRIFALLAVGWSFSEGKPTAADYDRLSAVTGKWVDDCLADAIQIGRGEIEGKESSPETPSVLPDSSPVEESPASDD